MSIQQIKSGSIASVASSALIGQVPDANAPSGSVIQVVQATTTTVTSTTSASYADVTGLAASITPTSASSKILVLVDYNIYAQASDTSRAGIRLLRDATTVITDDGAHIVGTNANVNVVTRSALNYLDSPSTTSSVTYKVQVARLTSAGTSYAISLPSGSGRPATITLMEIAA